MIDDVLLKPNCAHSEYGAACQPTGFLVTVITIDSSATFPSKIMKS